MEFFYIFFSISMILLVITLINDGWAIECDHEFILEIGEKRRIHNRRLQLRRQIDESRLKAYHTRQLSGQYLDEGDKVRAAVLDVEAEAEERRADLLRDKRHLLEKLERDHEYREITQGKDL